jgi:hypothetical protein
VLSGSSLTLDFPRPLAFVGIGFTFSSSSRVACRSFEKSRLIDGRVRTNALANDDNSVCANSI